MVVYQIPMKRKRRNFWNSLSLTKKIIALNVVTFVIFSILISVNLSFANYIFISAEGISQGYIWTFLTGMFMHGGVGHLFVNMLSLFFIGSLVERILGKKRYLIFYLIAGLAAGLLHILFESMPAVGASGALFGLIGLLVFLTPNLPVYLMFIPIPIKMKYAAPGILILLWLITLGTGAPIGNFAHLGGLVAGLAYGFYIRQKFPNKIKYLERQFS